MEKTSKGRIGEKMATDYLIKNGYKILETNYRCLYGEIDIIASQKNITIFIEVKYRKNDGYGLGYEAVGSKKIKKIIKTAEIYIEEKDIDTPCRFDIISIDAEIINHIENAFSL